MKDSSLTDFKNKDVFFGNVLVIGLGMIGGSFAKALKSRNLARVYGSDRRLEELTLGLATEVIDVAVNELTKDTVQQMDVILLATPVRAMESVLLELKPLLAPHTLVTDVGSTKGSIVAAAKSVFGVIPANFIPGHPIAGAEKNGVLAANANLFEQHKVILTPLPDSNPKLLDTLHSLWAAIGAEVLSMDVEHHDNVLANSSHLPHLLAYTLVDALANNERSQDIFRFAAGGFRDFTRIASSDPTMWRDIFLANKDATLASLTNFTEHLQQIKEFIEKSDGPAMFGVFTRAKAARDHFLRLQERNQVLIPRKPVSLKVNSSSLIKGEPRLFGDKLLSQKVLVLAAIADGVSDIKNIDQTVSVNITLQALRDMGVVVEDFNNKHLRIHGVGLRGLKAPIAPINVHNSELSLHALLPVLAVQPFSVTITGEGELLNHPFTELVGLIRAMGVDIGYNEANCLPFHLDAKLDVRFQLDAKPNVEIHPQITKTYQVHIDKYSEQIELAALMAAIASRQEANIEYGYKTVKYSSHHFLADFGCNFVFSQSGINIAKSTLTAATIKVPDDSLKVAWLTLLACLAPGSKLRISNAFVNAHKTSFLGTLQSMGSKINQLKSDMVSPDFMNAFDVGFSALRSFAIEGGQLNALQNELLLLCVAAVYAEGVSHIEGINTLPYHLQDQISALLDALNILDVPCKLVSGVLEIEGTIPNGGELDCAGDYQLALAMLALGVRSRKPIIVHDCQKLLEEFEEFETLIEQVGFSCQTVSQ